MKKHYTYALIFVPIVLFACLAVIYRMNNPERPVPLKTYTEKKASLLITDYGQFAETDEDGKKTDRVFAVLVETAHSDYAATGVSASFSFYDVTGAYAHADSKGAGTTSDIPQLSKSITDEADALFDDSFKTAENSDYGIPDEKTVKVYVRRISGVYFRVYAENELPECFGESYTG
ncbi:MAG: hypothetical protein J5879_00305 [Clostridia bacterium]|nr:hypothetical protein [Clostridia bacterium]